MGFEKLKVGLDDRPFHWVNLELGYLVFAACVGAQDNIQPGKGALIVLPLPANITNPGRKFRDGDQFTAEPGKVSDVLQADVPSMAAWAGIALLFW